MRVFDTRGGLLGAPDLRQKPELASSDGVDTTLPQFAPFYGTSAAAPSAAGIAALIMGAKPSMSVNELYAIMTSPVNALACASSAPLADCGAGFLLADRALTQGLDSTPPVIAAAVTPAAPTGANGWYVAPVQLAWSVSDDGSPVTDAAGCATSATADAATTFSCSATSAGGPASLSLPIRLDSTPPTAPAFAGISAGVVYHPATLPAVASVGCAASDATSGVASCTVTGYSSAPGPHVLTAVAVNDAGLSSTSTLAYTVAKPAAISSLTAGGGLTLRKLMRSGMSLTVAVATASTRLSIALVAKTPKQAGHKVPDDRPRRDAHDRRRGHRPPAFRAHARGEAAPRRRREGDRHRLDQRQLDGCAGDEAAALEPAAQVSLNPPHPAGRGSVGGSTAAHRPASGRCAASTRPMRSSLARLAKAPCLSCDVPGCPSSPDEPPAITGHGDSG